MFNGYTSDFQSAFFWAKLMSRVALDALDERRRTTADEEAICSDSFSLFLSCNFGTKIVHLCSDGGDPCLEGTHFEFPNTKNRE